MANRPVPTLPQARECVNVSVRTGPDGKPQFEVTWTPAFLHFLNATREKQAEHETRIAALETP